MKLVTVIVPVYNVEKYIEECIDSLICQTYKNIEIILVDDGSIDRSGKICDQYAEADCRIKVIHKKNEGLGFARNSGLDVAEGQYVTFVDSDDKVEKNLIELLMDGVNAYGCDTCIGGFKRIAKDGQVVFEEHYEEKIYEEDNVYNELFTRMLGSAPNKHDAIRMSVWNVMYSMDIVKNKSIRFPSERKYISEDIIWDSDYYKYARKVKVIGSSAYMYRITPESLTQKYKPDMLEKICALYIELCKRVLQDEYKIMRIQRQFLVNLRSCIKQEKASISKKNNKEIKKAIFLIVDNEVVHMVVQQYEKIIKQKKQKIFVQLVKNKFVNLLYLLVKIGKI